MDILAPGCVDISDILARRAAAFSASGKRPRAGAHSVRTGTHAGRAHSHGRGKLSDTAATSSDDDEHELVGEGFGACVQLLEKDLDSLQRGYGEPRNVLREMLIEAIPLDPDLPSYPSLPEVHARLHELRRKRDERAARRRAAGSTSSVASYRETREIVERASQARSQTPRDEELETEGDETFASDDVDDEDEDEDEEEQDEEEEEEEDDEVEDDDDEQSSGVASEEHESIAAGNRGTRNTRSRTSQPAQAARHATRNPRKRARTSPVSMLESKGRAASVSQPASQGRAGSRVMTVATHDEHADDEELPDVDVDKPIKITGVSATAAAAVAATAVVATGRASKSSPVRGAAGSKHARTHPSGDASSKLQTARRRALALTSLSPIKEARVSPRRSGSGSKRAAELTAPSNGASAPRRALGGLSVNALQLRNLGGKVAVARPSKTSARSETRV